MYVCVRISTATYSLSLWDVCVCGYSHSTVLYFVQVVVEDDIGEADSVAEEAWHWHWPKPGL